MISFFKDSQMDTLSDHLFSKMPHLRTSLLMVNDPFYRLPYATMKSAQVEVLERWSKTCTTLQTVSFTSIVFGERKITSGVGIGNMGRIACESNVHLASRKGCSAYLYR